MRIALLGRSALMLSASMFLAAGGLASAAPAPSSRPARADPWATQAAGLERAKQVTDQCFAHVDMTPRQSRYSCVRAAYEACEDEHGTSQHDINDCSAFSNAAWEARIASTISRFLSAKSTETRLFAKTEEAKQHSFRAREGGASGMPRTANSRQWGCARLRNPFVCRTTPQ